MSRFVVRAGAVFVLLAPLAAASPAAAQTPAADPTLAALGAPTPDSLARLVAARFATGTETDFDSVFIDPLGRRVLQAAVQRKSTREGGPAHVLAVNGDRAVLLVAPLVRSGRGRGISSGGNATNQVRRLSGFYDARRVDGTWRLGHQIPLDSGNVIHAQHIHVALDPGHESRIVDTLDLTVGARHGFAARLNTDVQLATVRLDGRDVAHQLAGGVLWIDAPPQPRSQLVLAYTIADEVPERSDTAHASPAPVGPPVFGALENTDAWLPFFGYDSPNGFALLSVTATIPAAYKLTTSMPQTERVENGLRIVHGESIHPRFILSLIYDKEWRSTTTRFGDVRFETLLAPGFRFSHDSLAKLAEREYALLTPRFGEPQAPSRYLVVVENRAIKGSGFTVRMNNAVVSGDNVTRIEELVLGPSDAFAHEVAHGWTMEASSFAANFLQEGWATFAEALVVGHLYGPQYERAMWERIRTGYVGGQDRAGFLGGFEGRQSILGDPDNGRIHYTKGSWILHQLEYALGPAVFDRGIRTYVQNAGHGANGYREFIDDMSRAAGHDVAPLVMPWLTEKYIPDVDAHVVGRSLIVTQRQPTPPFDLPLDVELLMDGGASVRRPIHLTRAADTIDVGSVGPITDVRVDPDHHFLIKRHWGDTARIQLRAPAAKTVELSGAFASKPIPATREGDIWTVEVPLTEGRYTWYWRVDGKQPADDVMVADAKRPAGDLDARAGVLVVRPVRRLPDAEAR
ncbi:MAG TPA: M1 family aminopeptidase [Gemmatimonadaceae bacterium]